MSLIIYADVSKWGRLRARPVDDTASNKEWPRSKFLHDSVKKFREPQQDITGPPRYILKNYFCLLLFLSLIIYADVSKWGRLRARPVDDTASNKEWPRSKFDEAQASNKFWATATGHNGAAPLYFKNLILLVALFKFNNIYADVSKWS